MTRPHDLVRARTCAWSEDGRLLAVASTMGVVLWNIDEGLVPRPIGAAIDVEAIAFEGTERLWLAGDRTLACHDLVTGAQLRYMTVAWQIITLSVAARRWVALVGEMLVVGSFDDDGEVRLLRPDRPVSEDEDEDYYEPVGWDEARLAMCVAFAPDGRRLVAGYADGACWSFPLDGAAPRQLQAADDRVVSQVAWGLGGELVVLAGDGRFALFSGATGKRRPIAPEADRLFERVTAIAISPRTGEMAISSEYDAVDGTVEDLEFIRVDEVNARAERRYVQIRDLTTRRHITSASAMRFDPTGRVLAVCELFGGIALWNVEARTYMGNLDAFAARTAGMLDHWPRTIGEAGRIELLGAAVVVDAVDLEVLPHWAGACTISAGPGPLVASLLRVLAGRDGRSRGR